MRSAILKLSVAVLALGLAATANASKVEFGFDASEAPTLGLPDEGDFHGAITSPGAFDDWYFKVDSSVHGVDGDADGIKVRVGATKYNPPAISRSSCFRMEACRRF